MTITEIANRIKSLKSALIFCHIRPDGDTLSCAFALKEALFRIGVNSEVVCGEQIPEKYSQTGLFGKAYTEPPIGYESAIAVDCATPDLMGRPYAFFERVKGSFCIDHHPTNTRYAAYTFVKAAASCSMNVCELIEEMGVEIDEKLANLLLVGIITDSGSFSHTNTDAECLSLAAKLSKKGGDIPRLNRLLFCNKKKEEVFLKVEVMSKMKFFLDDKLAIITVRKDLLEKYNLDRSATEGFIDFPLTVKSVEVAISMLEAGDKKFKLSFRSKTIDVSKIAGVFGGGGHAQAAGAMLCGYYEDVLDKLVFTVGNYLC